MVQKRVRRAAVGVGITVGVLAGLTLLFRYTNAGKYVTDSLRGFGQNVGLGVVAPFTGIVEGVTVGAGALGEAAKAASEGFQKSVSETLGGGFNVFSEFGKIIGGQNNAEQQPPKQDTQPLPTDNPRPGNTEKRPTAPNTQVKPPTTTTKPTTATTKPPTQQVQVRITSPTTGITTNKQIVTSTANSVKFRQNDGDIIYVSPSTAKILQSRGTGKIVTSQNPTVQTVR